MHSLYLCQNLIQFVSVFLCSFVIDAYGRETLHGVTIRNWPYADRKDGRYEGYVVDLMNDIREIAGFDYRLYFTPDHKYGGVQEDGKVNGMIGEVWSNRADFAIADLTITDSRRRYVDFTEPFMDLGLAALIHKSNVGEMKTFQDLADQDRVSYGTFRYGSIYYYFSDSFDPIIRKMYLMMAKHPQHMVTSTREGVDNVNSTQYAFIVESTMAEYLTSINCNLTFIDDQMKHFPRQYAIAVPKGSPYKEAFNKAIRKLKANGRLEQIKKKYWSNKCSHNLQWIDNGFDVDSATTSYLHSLLATFALLFTTFYYISIN